ncbi:hypothetical protein Ait01nite_091280 [Actinoplanes italicus]|uniref:Uncharacterized protein n=1 Tax=Actinoplanes italicus TaxID=113567 RepID=A0A2T0JSB9_9ACTN|nr:hypothetical protein [Actinoplanes italicus]PRX10529.1 hypothetical protein CLV67_1339 [Actinoplanes italicus]GIE36083.1 hypothetical protein Ait01nite_091280 [Actinoplanes italicus]
MPHTSDRRRRAQRCNITGEPARLAVTGLPTRNETIAMSPGQKALQSALMRVFANQGQHAWDPLRGRRLAGLFDYYGTWISPQPDRVVMAATVAHRLCGYLLPYTDPDEQHPRCAGIPGLRLRAYTTYGYELVHLPTNTPVEIHDDQSRCSPRFREEVLRTERRMHRGEEERTFRPVWREPALTGLEQRWASVWQLQPHTEITSALFCIQPVFLHDPAGPTHSAGNWARHLQLACSPAPDTPSVLTWCDGLQPGRIAEYLETLALISPGIARIDAAGPNYATLTLGRASIEMHRRHLCTQCHLDKAFTPTRPDPAAA